jgi:serine/threonine protein kinase
MQRLRLFRLVCEAVQYAHQNLLVQRDLKPSNILTIREGIPKLLDFGIAKVIDPGTPPGVTYTQREVRMMTPDYASPEQVNGLQISTASDIYSLTICETDPPKPSLKVDKACAGALPATWTISSVRPCERSRRADTRRLAHRRARGRVVVPRPQVHPPEPAVGAALLVAASLIVGMVTTTIQARRA